MMTTTATRHRFLHALVLGLTLAPATVTANPANDKPVPNPVYGTVDSVSQYAFRLHWRGRELDFGLDRTQGVHLLKKGAMVEVAWRWTSGHMYAERIFR